jgi:hypothetical protein
LNLSKKKSNFILTIAASTKLTKSRPDFTFNVRQTTRGK